MSSKRNKSSKDDNFFMEQALSLASKNIGLTGENPSVGCVLIKRNQIISAGVTGLNGRPHAETVALNKNFKNAAGATAYITLEPCSHHGVTSPCTEALIKSNIKKVFYSIDDVDKRSFQKAKHSTKVTTVFLLLRSRLPLYQKEDVLIGGF